MTMNRPLTRWCASVLMVGLSVLTGRAQTTSPEDLYQQAVYVQEAKGDLAKAIDLFRTIASQYPQDAVAPKALLELAGSMETLGRPGAADIYRRIVSEYATSPVAGTARTRLAALDPATPMLAMRNVWDHPAHAISKDGKFVVIRDDWVHHPGSGDIDVLDLASGRLTNVTRSNVKQIGANNIGMAVSHNNREIAYMWGEPGQNAGQNGWVVRAIGKEGGAARVIYASGDPQAFPYVVDWLPGDTELLVNLRAGNGPNTTVKLLVFPAAGGAPRLVHDFTEEHPTNPIFLMHLAVSPDGRFVAGSLASGGKTDQHLFILSMADGTVTKVDDGSSDNQMLAWTPDGRHVLFVSNRGGVYGVWALTVIDGRAQGDAALVQANTGVIQPLGMTTKGDFYYKSPQRSETVAIATLDPASGQQVGAASVVEGRDLGGKTKAAWSPDGQRLAYAQATTLGPASSTPEAAPASPLLAIHTIATGDVRLIDLHLGNLQNPAWAPDGSAIFVQGGPPQGLYRVDVQTGSVTPVAVQEQSTDPARALPAVSRDGRWLFAKIVPPAGPTGRGIAARDLSTGAEKLVFQGDCNGFALSPDGQWLAVAANGGGRSTLRIVSTSGEPAKALSPSVADWPIGKAVEWSPDGRSVFVVRDPDGQQPMTWQVPVDGSEPRSTGITWPTNLVDDRMTAAPDGRRLAISFETLQVDTWVMSNVTAVIKK